MTLALATATAGCYPGAPPEPTPAPGTYRLAADILPEPVQALDLLFVMDNSDSMLEEQVSIAARAQEALFDVLQATGGKLPDLHLAVVSTDVGANPAILNCEEQGDDGVFRTGAASDGTCGLVDGRFLVDVDNGAGGRDSNYEGALSDAFACMVQLGTGGCGFEQPLEAMRRALDGSNPENAGFLREDAMLAVVLVTDEDDCSTFDRNMFSASETFLWGPLGPLHSFRCFDFGVTCDQANREPGVKTGCQPREDSMYMFGAQEYVDFLHGLKGDPGMVVVAGIFGDSGPVEVVAETASGSTAVTNMDLSPSCVSASGVATPGVRLGGFLGGFPARHLQASICADDMRGPLTQAAKRIADATTGSLCLQGVLADADAGAPGVQAACRVRVEQPGGTWTELGACGKEDDAACFEVVRDALSCGHTETGLAVDLARAAAEGARVQVECRIP